MEGAPRRSSGVDSLLLQLRKTSQGTEIRTRGPNTGHAGGIGHQAADVQGDLLLNDAFLSTAKCHVRFLRLGHVDQCGRFAPFYSGVATLDGGSTPDPISIVRFRQHEDRGDGLLATDSTAVTRLSSAPRGSLA